MIVNVRDLLYVSVCGGQYMSRKGEITSVALGRVGGKESIVFGTKVDT